MSRSKEIWKPVVGFEGLYEGCREAKGYITHHGLGWRYADEQVSC